MRKFALLLAAAVIVSAPMLTTVSTDTFAAAKAKSKAKSDAPENGGFWLALGANLEGKSVEAGSGKKGKGKKGGKK